MSHCPRCQTPFSCGVVDTDQPLSCWCMTQARLPTPAESERGTTCLCAHCLEQERLHRLAQKSH